MATSRRSARERGKSDRIDALAVARAALAEGVESLPTAALAGPELDVRLLVDHRERLVRQRVGINNTLQWNLHDLWPELVLPGGALFSRKWSTRIGRRLARAEQTMRVRIARDELRRLRELTQAIRALEARDRRPGGPSRAAAAHRARVRALDRGQARRRDRRRRALRHRRQARPRRRLAPIPVSSGNTNRHRLDRGGNRQINAAIHRVAVTRARCHPETRDYIARKTAEGKTTREAIRCLKRHLARHIWRLLRAPHPVRRNPPHQFLT